MIVYLYFVWMAFDLVDVGLTSCVVFFTFLAELDLMLSRY